MRAIRFRKLFSLSTDNYGLLDKAVVVYQKAGILFQTIDRGPHPDGQFFTQTVRWRHYLRVDLWLVVLDFEWCTGKHLV